MKAIRIAEPKKLERIEIESPAPPGPHYALVQTHRMGICGTDYSGYLGKMPFFRYPRIPGHELGVEVLEIGKGVSNVQPGDRCSVEPYMNCGTCLACRKGRGNCCARLEVIGVMVDGGLCERFLIRADKLHASPSLSYEQLALVETLAIGCHAVDRGIAEQGMQVLLIGAGPIGLSVLEFTRLTGAEITVMDISEERLEFCRRTYDVAHTIVFRGDGSELEQLRQITRGELFEVVTDATGNAGSMSRALEYVAPTGHLVYVGITTDAISFAHPTLHRPEITLCGSRNALPGDFTRILRLMEEGAIDTGPWITHRSTFEEVIERFPEYVRPGAGVIKAIIEVA